MTQLLRTSLFIIGSCLLVTTYCTAQSFQWGKRAGSAQSVSSSQWEHVNSMAVDANGNIYALGHVAQASINVDGDVKNGNGGWDIVLASFTCNGNLRWWKVIGGSGNDYTFELGADRIDGIYLSCFIQRSQSGQIVHIDADTTITTKTYSGMSLIKYDTAGHYKWFRAPQADTIGLDTYNNTGDIGMAVDNSGNVYWMWQMAPSVYLNGALTVAKVNDYMVKYDRNGNLIGTLDLKMRVGEGHLARNSSNGNFYYAGDNANSAIPMSINGTPLTSRKFVVAFDKNGNLIWQQQGDNKGGGFYGNIDVDKEGSIYLATGFVVGEKFLGYTPQIAHTAPAIVKLDSSGNLKWAIAAKVNAATFFDGGVALRNSGEVILHGSFPGLLKWPGFNDSFNLPINSGYRPYITRFNTQTGKVLGIDQLPAVGQTTEEFATISDGRNNVYIGGDFDNMLTVNGITLNKLGGETDWFIAKYGHSNCNCTNIPELKFSMTATGQNANFNYAGSTGITSYRWDFGDGDTSTASNPTHRFKDSGAYTVCVKVTNSCGDNTYCSQVYVFPTGIDNAIKAGGVSIYPNPAIGTLQIDGLENGMPILIQDMTGRIMYQGLSYSPTELIDISSFASGNYVIQLTDKQSNRITKKIQKIGNH